MNKKHLIMVLIVFLMVPLMVPQGCAQNATSESIIDNLRLLYFDTITEITIDNKTLPASPMKPSESFYGIEATVQFKFETPFLFPKFLINTKIGKWIMFRDKDYDMSVNISLSVAEKPEWMDVDLPKQIKIENIGTSFKESLFKFNITVNETAEAFLEDDIKIKATFNPEDGCGLKTSEESYAFNVKSGYVGKIEANFTGFENISKIEFKAGETKIFHLKIKNIGNGETTVRIQKINNSDISATFEQENITLKINEEITANVSITARDTKDGFSTSTDFELTPISSTDPSLTGDTIIVKTPTIYKKLDTDYVGILGMIGLAIIIIIIIALIIWFILRKIKRKKSE